MASRHRLLGLRGGVGEPVWSRSPYVGRSKRWEWEQRGREADGRRDTWHSQGIERRRSRALQFDTWTLRSDAIRKRAGRDECLRFENTLRERYRDGDLGGKTLVGSFKRRVSPLDFLFFRRRLGPWYPRTWSFSTKHRHLLRKSDLSAIRNSSIWVYSNFKQLMGVSKENIRGEQSTVCAPAFGYIEKVGEMNFRDFKRDLLSCFSSLGAFDYHIQALSFRSLKKWLYLVASLLYQSLLITKPLSQRCVLVIWHQPRCLIQEEKSAFRVGPN